ncbi:MAG: PDZ domain-containing protein [Nitrospira sp.]|nr:PDZ domain-containing protein [Nitrospira sp.]
MIMGHLVVWIVMVVLLAGCASSGDMDQARKAQEKKKTDTFLADKPQELHPVFAKIVAEGERNHVLNRLRAGLAAMQSGYNDLAAQTFDDALLTIETIYGGDEKAKAARGLFSAEDRKVFRGEPYERAMAYYYRGILYLMGADYENARASFQSGFLQDTLAEREEFRGDFALLTFLEGWASQCNGNSDLADETYALARDIDGSLVMPDTRSNTLVLADLGYAPTKYAAGEHNELLKIKASPHSTGEYAVSWLDHRLPNSENILRQATTRGGREFDTILAGKAQFKEASAAVAETAAIVSATAAVADIASTALGSGIEDQIPGLSLLGGAAGLLSLASGAASAATQPAADTRHWDNLPEKVAYGTYRVNGMAPKAEVKSNRAWLGIRMKASDSPQGVMVVDLLPDSPAAKAGIRAGDIIESLAGQQIESTSDYFDRIAAFKPDAEIQIGLRRNGIHEGIRAVRLGMKPMETTRQGGDQKCTVVWARR